MKVEATNGYEGEKKPAGAKRKGEKLVRKRGCSRGTRRRVQAASTAIQRLYVACKTVFKDPKTVPEAANVEMLQRLLDEMRPEDVGLSTDALFRVKSSSKGTPKITYAMIYKCDNFSISIFFLPPRAIIPLHNHPGMTVFSKLLAGSVHIKSYDWLDPGASNSSKPSPKLRLAKLVVDSDFTAPCDTSILYPTTGGNIHTFTAITACAVLDVQGPPYSKEEDRDITYYRDYPYRTYPNDMSLEEEAERKAGWLLKLFFIGTAALVAFEFFPYMGETLLQQSISLLHVKDPLFKRMGASRLALYAVDDERRMKVVEMGGALDLLNMLKTAKDDKTRKQALKTLVALSHSDEAAEALHQADAIAIVSSTPNSVEYAEVETYKSSLLKRFQELKHEIPSEISLNANFIKKSSV
nr:PREDICTED: plant cysteine oxidase 2 isoform X1 [Musa acuminata subsp. malaccensis]